MGFYFQKSIRVGPLRFNLSKSGVGVSAGIPGFRVGTGPRGNYVHMGVGGLYYRATLPSGSRSHFEPRESESVDQPFSHSTLKEIGSSDVSLMIDSSSAALLSEIKQKKKRMLTWPFAVGLGVAIMCIVIAIKAPLWIIILVAAISLIGAFAAYQYDLLSKTVVILYDLDSVMEGAYDRVHNCINQLARCRGKWHIDARGNVYDPKYHGGAGELVKRNRISIGTGSPPYIKTNIAIPYIPLGSRTLYFFPEHILVVANNGIGAVSYNDLSIIVNDKQFIEAESVPSDAHVVDHTWQFVNKGGGPDRRFRNNRRIPICLYEELWFNSPTGLNEVIQASQTGTGKQLDAAFQNLADFVAKAAAMPASASQTMQPSALPRSSQSSDQESIPDNDTSDYLFDVLLDILCCVMVSDGRASTSERKCIRERMSEMQSPWTESQVDDHMAAFIVRVQNNGYRRTLATAMKDVEIFKRVGKQSMLLRCLHAVAQADGIVSDRERQLCERVKAIVE